MTRASKEVTSLRFYARSRTSYALLENKMSFNYPVAVRFQCLKCGICCGDTKEKTRHILLLRTETEQIAATTLQPISEFTVKIKNKTPYSYEMKKRKMKNASF
jgi:hypothetical protein